MLLPIEIYFKDKVFGNSRLPRTRTLRDVINLHTEILQAVLWNLVFRLQDIIPLGVGKIPQFHTKNYAS